MLNKEDMNKYHTQDSQGYSQRTEGEFSQSAGATAKTVGGMAWRTVKTVLLVLIITGLLVFVSVMSYILSFRDVVPPNLSEAALSFSSKVYVTNDNGEEVDYMSFFANENRVWVSLSDIPAEMQTAQICIEDHRFYQHHGVDWRNTMGAVAGLVGGGSNRGGSTITQQLVKNLTGEKQVSILRKVKEIFTALNMEGGYYQDGEYHSGYSKEEILETYLNLVNYGGQNQGVEAAANDYFGKHISECSLAECALIAGITQNPSQYYPYYYPEQAKDRARTVLGRMLELSEEGELTDERLVNITQDEYDAAMAELDAMTFGGQEMPEEETTGETAEEAAQEREYDEKWNWYIDTMFEDIVRDLMETQGISRDLAVSNIYNAGYEIHCAMNVDLQTNMEEYFLENTDMLPADQAIELGFFMMDPYSGKVMTVIGSRYERSGRLLYNNATQATRQPGSSIKPVGPYSLGIHTGTITYGSVLNDIPVPGYYGEGSTEEGPSNYSLDYTGSMNVDRAIEQSQNAPAAWLAKELTPQAVFDWMTNQLHFTTLDAERDPNLAPMALGGLTNGVTVRELTAAYQVFANGGVYHEPYTYTYVKDHDGNVILDNRPEANPGEQVMSVDDATVMNKLLQRPHLRVLGYGYQHPQRPAHPDLRQDRHHRRRVRPVVRGVHPLLRGGHLERLRRRAGGAARRHRGKGHLAGGDPAPAGELRLVGQAVGLERERVRGHFLPQQRQAGRPRLLRHGLRLVFPRQEPGHLQRRLGPYRPGLCLRFRRPGGELRPLSGAYVRAQRPAQYRAQPGAHGRAQLQRL